MTKVAVKTIIIIFTKSEVLLLVDFVEEATHPYKSISRPTNYARHVNDISIYFNNLENHKTRRQNEYSKFQMP